MIREYFREHPHVIDNWLKLLFVLFMALVLPGWWALLPFVVLLTLR